MSPRRPQTWQGWLVMAALAALIVEIATAVT
jgi:hypothetical protein